MSVEVLDQKSDVQNPYLKMKLPQLIEAQEQVLAHLNEERQKCEAALQGAKETAELIESAVRATVAQEIDDARRYNKLPTGTMTVIIDGHEVKSSVPGKVAWDTGLLDEASSELEVLGENPADWIEYKLSIPMRNYKKMPSSVKSIVDRARTLTPGKEIITIEKLEKK